MTAEANIAGGLIEVWTLPFTARLGSSVRSKGIYLEIRARLPATARKSFTVKAGELTLRMPQRAAKDFSAASAIVSSALEGIENLPVIPREIEIFWGFPPPRGIDDSGTAGCRALEHAP